MLADRAERISALSELLPHGDPAQVAFQSTEIAGDLAYTRRGITVTEGDSVVDVGGNVGASAAFFATQCGAAAVHSLEPVPATYADLAANLEPIPGCFPHPVGLAAETGTVTMFTYEGGDSVLSGVDSEPARLRELLAIAGRNLGLSDEQAEEMAAARCVPTEVECRVQTFSDFVAEHGIDRVDLLKLDVEGAEADVLRGIEESDWPMIRQVAAEIHSDGLLREVTEQLESHSFRVTVEQSPDLAGTPIRFLYAHR